MNTEAEKFLVPFLPEIYIAIDLKSYYASVECVARGLDPLKANLVVADESRTDKTICLAVSPSLKAIGVPGRPRLFEAKQKIREYEAAHHTKVDYIVAIPRMAEYIRVSSLIYSIYLKYASPDDIHVYSIDECFVSAGPYLHFYRKAAADSGNTPAHCMAMVMIRDVLKTTGITATAGIGTNLYLAKVAMDVTAKKSPPDKDGVRIAELNEAEYCRQLWDHRPLTDFWQVGPGYARRLARLGMFTMGDIAEVSLAAEDILYKEFGIDAEILIDHAWGLETVTMADIKSYHSQSHSSSVGQVLSRPYPYKEARIVFAEMAEELAQGLVQKHLLTDGVTFWVSFDPKTLESGLYTGPITLDFYGRLHPVHTGGTVRFPHRTSSAREIREGLLAAFTRKVAPYMWVRRLGVAAMNIRADDGFVQLDLFTDFGELEKENRMQEALVQIRRKYGKNAVLKGLNLLKGGTQIERNSQIGGHRQ